MKLYQNRTKSSKKYMYCTSARQNQVYKPYCHLFQACETVLTMLFIYFLNFRRKLDVDMVSKSPLLRLISLIRNRTTTC